MNMNISLNEFINRINAETGYDRFMHLKIYTDNEEMRIKYRDHINNHHNKMLNKLIYADSGFDILMPYNNGQDIEFQPNTLNMIDLKIKCSANMILLNRFNNNNDSNNFMRKHATGFYTYPRSSICKTKVRLANNTGIIDAGYRGTLKGAFDVLPNINEVFYIEPYSKLLQICAPSLEPIYVELVNSENELGEITMRGEGGFGSTGR